MDHMKSVRSRVIHIFRPEFEGQFIIFNETNELELLQKFFDHILDVKPHIFVTYNGDFFDWPFIEARATVHGMDMSKEIGFAKNRYGPLETSKV